MNTSAIQSGSIYRTLIKLSIPIMIGMVFDLLYNLVDTFFIALIDKESTAIVAGVGLVFPLVFLIFAFTQAIFAGVSTKVAIDVGRQDTEDLQKTAVSGLVVSVLISLLIIGLFGVYGKEIIHILAGRALTPQSLQHGLDYLIWFIPGTLFLTTSHVYLGILQGQGRTEHLGRAMVISTVINIILDPLFIFGLGLGVRGAAMATVIAWFFLLLYTFIVFQVQDQDQPISLTTANISAKAVKEIIRLGLPQGLGMLAMAISFVFLNGLVSSIGEDVMNAFTLVGRVDTVLITPVLAFSIGIGTMVGQNYGSGQLERIKEVVAKGTILTMGLVLTICLLYILLAPVLFPFLTGVAQVRELAVRQVRYISVFLAAGITLGICSGAAFQAVAQPVKSFVTIITRIGLVTLPLAYLLVWLFGRSIQMIWIALAVGNIIGGALCFAWWQKYIGNRIILQRGHEQ